MALHAAVHSAPAGAGHLSRRNFDRLARYIRDTSGIKMPDSKITMLEGRLRRRVHATGQPSIDAYCERLFEADNLAAEGLHLINAVTTNKTDFFREPAHFQYLSDTVLPDLAERGVRTIRAWSAACSTGPEAYTLAMVLDDRVRAAGAGDFTILATDLDTEVLHAAHRGVYPADMIEPVPERLRRKYLLSPRDTARREVRIVPELRSAIGFAPLNLMDGHYPVGAPMDLIFCRNVLIYFDKPTQRQVVSRLLDCLAPQGHLFLGHSETITGFDLPLEQVANTVFRRRR